MSVAVLQLVMQLAGWLSSNAAGWVALSLAAVPHLDTLPSLVGGELGL